MGIVRAFRRITDSRISAVDKCVSQYHDACRLGVCIPSIPRSLFVARYMCVRLDDEAVARLEHYYDMHFNIETMIDFVLAVLDVELFMEPSSNKGYFQSAQAVADEMSKQSVPIRDTDIDKFMDKWFNSIGALRRLQ